MARKRSTPSTVPSKKYDFSKYLTTESADAELAKTKREWDLEQADLELSSNDLFPSKTANNESISPNMEEIKGDGDGNKVWNSSEQAISTIFAEVARDSWPYEGEDPNYFGSKFRNEIETKDPPAVEENKLKMDKNEKFPGNEDPWIPISVVKIPSYADFENEDEHEIKKTNNVSSASEYFQYSNDHDYYQPGSKFRNEIPEYPAVVVPWWAIEENEFKMDKNKSPPPSKFPGNEDPWIPISVEKIPSFTDFENDGDVKKTNIVSSQSEYFQYLNDDDYCHQLYNMDTGRIVDLDHNGHEVFVGTVNIIGRYEMKQYPGMIQRLCNDIDKGWYLNFFKAPLKSVTVAP